jgi:Flp pilus assembly protein TadD
MLLGWFDARRAAEIGVSLADQFASRATSTSTAFSGKQKSPPADALRDCLQRADREVRIAPLNFYKKAKLANAFKWRLLEKGVANTTAAEVTQTLVMHLSMNRLAAVTGGDVLTEPTQQPTVQNARDLLAEGDKQVALGAYAIAIEAYRAFLELKPNHARGLNNLGAAHWKLGSYRQAEDCFRRAIRLKPNDPDAHSNLGGILRGRGHLAASENSLRRALKLNPTHVEARVSLGLTLFALGRPSEAKPHLQKALRVAPDNVGALICMAKIASTEGHFDDAKALLERILTTDPQSPTAWATLVGLRKMTAADSAWLERAEAISAGGVTPLEEVDLRFAMGKYCDDIRDYARAFPNYQRANELLKANAPSYDRSARTRFVDELIQSHSRERLRDSLVAPDGERGSTLPVFVVGMPRSGTSLVEQIIASHPAASGAGELGFWSALVQRYETVLRQGPLGLSQRTESARACLRELRRHSEDAQRIVDKSPVNSDFLGIIHSVFPNARIVYMQRDPIDTCLSCYFQQFQAGLDYTMDLADLAHYYRNHERLMSHWRAVLPPGTLLEVPYAGLVSDQENWTRKILEFIGLDWNESCLNFQKTHRTVATASAWQVRQGIYKSSMERWRNYEKVLGPLLELRDSYDEVTGAAS